MRGPLTSPPTFGAFPDGGSKAAAAPKFWKPAKMAKTVASAPRGQSLAMSDMLHMCYKYGFIVSISLCMYYYMFIGRLAYTSRRCSQSLSQLCCS